MSQMDQMLASFFGTGSDQGSQPTTEDAEKVAQAEFFAKTAAAQGINLEELNASQIDWLWGKTFAKEAGVEPAGQQKVAEFPPKDGGGAPPFPPKKDEKKDDGDDEKKKLDSAARKEHEEKKEAAAHFERATTFGKTAAHAYVHEMKNIIGAGGLDFMKEAGKVDQAMGAVGKHLESTGKKAIGLATGRTGAEAAASPRTAKAVGAAAHAVGAAAAGAGAHAAMKKKESSAGAFEMQAAELALAKIAASEFDRDQAIERLNAVLTLGLNESEKVASTGSYEDALERRSLEYAAAAGYPVEWAEG